MTDTELTFDQNTLRIDRQLKYLFGKPVTRNPRDRAFGFLRIAASERRSAVEFAALGKMWERGICMERAREAVARSRAAWRPEHGVR